MVLKSASKTDRQWRKAQKAPLILESKSGQNTRLRGVLNGKYFAGLQHQGRQSAGVRFIRGLACTTLPSVALRLFGKSGAVQQTRCFGVQLLSSVCATPGAVAGKHARTVRWVLPDDPGQGEALASCALCCW